MFKSPKHIKKVTTIRKLRVIEDYFAEPNLIHQDIEEYGNEY